MEHEVYMSELIPTLSQKFLLHQIKSFPPVVHFAAPRPLPQANQGVPFHRNPPPMRAPLGVAGALGVGGAGEPRDAAARDR